MKKTKNKIIAILLVSLMVMSSGMPAFASENNQDQILKISEYTQNRSTFIPLDENIKYIETLDGTLVAIEDLPSFATREEANEYINMIHSNLDSIDFSETNVINLNQRTTTGDALVAKRTVIVDVTGTVELRLFYRTSGDGNTGEITYCEAYTRIQGFTPGYSWTENLVYEEISSTGKDVYAYGTGTLNYSLLVEGGLEIINEVVNLEGTVPVIR